MRYFTAYFSYGLAILMQVAEFAGVDAPNMKESLEWYYGLVGKRNEFHYSDYGINTVDDFIEFYAR